MATIFYDGKSSVTAASTDTVVITADPTLFTQSSQNLNDAVLRFGTNTLTITNATVTTLTNVSLAGGTFQVGTSGNTSATGSSLYIGTSTATSFGTAVDNTNASLTTADSKNALFGGTGVSTPTDGNDSFAIGGKGSFLVYGNGGNDAITQNATAFDSTSAVTVFGGAGSDSVTLTAANKGSLLIFGGESTDAISVVNTGTTTIFGGTGAGDSADGADTIALGASGGTINVFGNGGDDIIGGTATAGAATTFANNTVANIFGGAGSDSIAIGFDTATSAKGVVTVYGGEGGDSISVLNTGTTTIYGGTGAGDSTDGADSIALGASGGTITVFGNAGNDIISGNGAAGNATSFIDGTNATIYGGKGNDSISLGYTSGAKGTITVYGGEDQDTISVANTAGSTATIYGGTGQGDSADGADSITITGAGNVTAFGNGGADTINVNFTGVANAASANVVTVYAGTGNDTINVTGLVNSQSTIVLNGNEGADTFVFGSTAGTNGTVAGTGFGASIADFTAGTDKITIQNGISGTGTVSITAVPTGGFADLQSALNAAAQGAAGSVAAVTFGGSSYVVLNTDGTAGFSASTDLAIKLTGVTDLNTVVAGTTVL